MFQVIDGTGEVDRTVVVNAFGPALGAVIKGQFGGTDGRPSFLHGWKFLSVVASPDPEALAIKGSADEAGPAVVFNPAHFCREDLEMPEIATMWLSPAIHHICYAALVEAILNGPIGRFTSTAWTTFRSEVEKHVGMEWEEIIVAARREGLDFMAEHMVQSLLDESGLLDAILDMTDGLPSVKIA